MLLEETAFEATIKMLGNNMQKLFDQLNSQCGWDCQIKTFDGWSLSIFSGTSFEYASPLATLSGVSYVSCPIEFSHPKFRVASSVEMEQINKVILIDEDEFLIVIEAETAARIGTHAFYIVAASLEINTNA